MKKNIITVFKMLLLTAILMLLPQNQVSVQAVDKLMIQGEHLTNASGQPVQLKGVSTHGLAWFPQYVNKDAFRTLKSWGCNTVRLALYPHEYNGYCTGGNTSELKKLVKEGVSYAKDLDMYVIIDWHVLNEQSPMVYKKQARSFFKEMAKTYRDCPNVLFEVCNEPNGGTDWSTIKKYAQEIIGIIRKQGSDAVVIVGTPTWSQDVDTVASNPIRKYSNIAYALHFYANTHTEWLRNRAQTAVSAGLPLFVSEFGICDASGNGAINVQEADLWMNFLDKNKISYMIWNLSNKDESSSLIQSSCSLTSGWNTSQLSPSGQWYVKHLGGKAKTSSKAKWVKFGKHYKYKMANGKYAKSRWLTINKKHYYFDKKGYRKTGWLKLNGKKYYFNSKGVRQSGKVKIKGRWYRFRSNGELIS